MHANNFATSLHAHTSLLLCLEKQQPGNTCSCAASYANCFQLLCKLLLFARRWESTEPTCRRILTPVIIMQNLFSEAFRLLKAAKAGSTVTQKKKKKKKKKTRTLISTHLRNNCNRFRAHKDLMLFGLPIIRILVHFQVI